MKFKNNLINKIGKMKFCSDCETMLSIKSIESEMFYYCTQCGTTEKSDNSVVYTQNYDNLIKYTNSSQLKDLKYDFSLARTKQYNCPHPECLTNTSNSEEKEAVFWRDQNDLSMTLVCTVCATLWKGMD